MSAPSTATSESRRSPKDRAVGYLKVLGEAGVRWSDDNCLSLGASLAYYAVFSIFPLLLLAVAGLGMLVGNVPGVRERILDSVTSATSPEFRKLFEETLVNMQTHETARGIGAVIGVITLFVGASAVFSELESTLNKIWRVPPAPARGAWAAVVALIRYKAVAFAVVAGTAAALLASLVVSSILSSIDQTVDRLAPESVTHATRWIVAEAVGSVGVLTVVLATMFRMIPQTKVEWRDVFGGAFVTALLFTATKRLLAWYLGHLGSYAAYGTVGGFLGLLTWIYLASLFLFYGAEVTRVYAERYGSVASHSPASVPRARPLRRLSRAAHHGRIGKHGLMESRVHHR
jgi:membrane protein